MAINFSSEVAKKLGITADEAEQFFEQHENQAIIIKLGGNVFIGDDKKKENEFIKTFAADIVLLKNIGAHPIVIHGGGPAIDRKLQQANIKVQFVKGLRYTDSAAMTIVAGAMADINYGLCRAIETAGGVALPHPDRLVLAKKLLDKNGAELDLGWVGQPISMAGAAADELLSPATIPILSPIGYDHAGHQYNINGDVFAGFIAVALRAERFLLTTNIKGLLDKNENLITSITTQEAKKLIDDGTISGGMIPKIETAIAAALGGVRAVAIIDGRTPHAVLRELFTARGNGTLISK